MATQDDYIRTALRVPPELHAQIHASAKANNRTFNAEIVARLQESFHVHGSGSGSGSVSMKMTAQGEGHVNSDSGFTDELADKVAARLVKMIPISLEDLERLTPDYAKPRSKKTPAS